MKALRRFIEIIGAMLLVLFLTITNVIAPFDYLLRDKLYQVPRGINTDIKIIAIDDKTLEELGPIQTWSRQVYADLINVLNTDSVMKPAVIAFDITFSGHVDDGDIAFAEAAEESGNVVVVSQILYKEKPIYDKYGNISFDVDTIVHPYEELKAVTTQGYSNVSQDSDGIVRRITTSQDVEGENWNAFSLEIYKKYCEQMFITESPAIKKDRYGRSLINYSGKPGDYEAISLVDVLDGTVNSKAFADSIVLVGAYATGLQDNFKVPNGGAKQMYGVEIHANLLQAYMQNRFSIHANPVMTGIILAILCGLLVFVFQRGNVIISTIVLIAAIVGEMLFGMWLNNTGLNMSLIYMPIVAIVFYVYCLVWDYIREKRKRKKVLNAFKKYVAPEIVQEIASKGDFQIKLGGENRDIAVLFVDIRGFTTMSEILSPEQVVEILNEYLGNTTEAIFKNKGTLDKFVGDAAMAVFNSPFDLDDYEFRAVCAAMDIVGFGKELEEKLMKKYGRTIGFGVGVNVGPAVVGNIGCDFRMDFTAIGDTVNTAARLEANAKKGQVLISDVLYERIKDRVEVEEVGNIPLKGKSNGVFVYSVTKVNRE